MSLNVLLANDLHNEFGAWWPGRATVQAADVVVLAGDIGSRTEGLAWARQAFGGKRIVYVAGNHEFYGAAYLDELVALRSRAQDLGIDFLENDEATIDGVRFLGCTLWTDFALFGDVAGALREAQAGMNDFGQIRLAPQTPFRPTHALCLHRRSRAWLERKLTEPFSGKTVVVSHHAPSPASIEPAYLDNPLSAAFASRLEALASRADLWLHGHTHRFSDYRIGACRVVCNPRGYACCPSENTGWKERLVLAL